MITQFKIFENKKVFEDEDDLALLFTQEFIEEYYKNDSTINAEEASMGVHLWDFVKDLEKVKNYLISKKVDGSRLEDSIFTKYDMQDYIENKLLKNIQPELDKFRKKYDLGFMENKDILDKMDKKDFIKILYSNNAETDFIGYFYEDLYDDTHPEDILIEIYGENTVCENLYGLIKEFLDDDEIIEEYYRKTDFENKFDYLKDNIYIDRVLQEKLLKINSDTVFALFDILEDDRDRNDIHKTIGDEYDFQKLYIDKNEDKEIAIKDLYNKFGINPKIAEEYKDYMYIIDAQNYNL
jgi:hypothetical protein